MKSFILALFLATSASAETIIIPVQDLLFEIPSYANAPNFDLNSALQGQWIPESPKRSDRKSQKKIEKQLIDMMWEEYPDAQSIRIWKGNLILKI